MKLRQGITEAFKTISASAKEMERLKKRSLEEVLEQYIKLLLASGALAAIFSIIVAFAKAAYYDLLRGLTVEYLRLLNYTLSLAAGTFFFYLFVGTFGLAILSALIYPFARLAYTRLVQVLCVATMPVLLFGWLAPRLATALLLWSLYLLLLGISLNRKT